jgi:hypothetical protein
MVTLELRTDNFFERHVVKIEFLDFPAWACLF